MRSTNPVLVREANDYTTQRNVFPGAWEGRAVTLDVVIVRSAALLSLLVLSAAFGWALNLPLGIAAVAGVAAFIIALVATFRRSVTPALFMAYSLLEGILIGSLSASYESAYRGIVLQAVVGVVCAFAVMLGLYTSGLFRGSRRFFKFLIAAAAAYILLMIVNLVASFFTPGGLGLADGGPVAILVSIVGVSLGAFFYILDFAVVEAMIKNGVPEREGWRAAFGLILTTVWVYLEVLRLLSFFKN